MNSFSRFAVKLDKSMSPTAALSAVAMHGFVEPEFLKAGIVSGFVTGEHLLDTDFSSEKNEFDQMLAFAVRIDVRKGPPDLQRAYMRQALEEMAKGNPSGFASRAQKAEAKRIAEMKIAAEIAQGKHCRKKMIPVVWDLSRGEMLFGSNSEKAVEQLSLLMNHAVDASISQVTAGELAKRFYPGDAWGLFEDMQPDAMTDAPEGAEGTLGNGGDYTVPLVPWVHGGQSVMDWLGNVMAIWTWYGATVNPDGFSARLFDSMSLDCAYDVGGSVAVKSNKNVGRHPEAIASLKRGMWPRRMSVLVGDRDGGADFQFVFQTDQLLVMGLKVSEHGEPDFESTRDQQMHELSRLWTVVDWMNELMRSFMAKRAVRGWATDRETIRAWIKAGCPSRRRSDGPREREEPRAKAGPEPRDESKREQQKHARPTPPKMTFDEAVELLSRISGIAADSIRNDAAAAKRAYRIAAKKTHPDTGGNAEDFKRVKLANQWLEARHESKRPREPAA